MGRRVVTVVVAVLVLALAAPAQAQTPPMLNWGEVLPGFTPGIDTSSSNVCTSGSHRCVESVLRTMAREFNRLAEACDHNAVFQLGYMRTTEAYYESSQIPGFYDDVPWMHHYDAVFAEYYMAPQRAWQRGDAAAVPPAWQQAFAAADAQELTALGNFMMGMNAHINRDLPFVLDDIGLTDADGGSRKPDHEQVNEFLNQVADDMMPELAARFDPTVDSSSADDVLVGFTVQQLIQEWRERAWHSAALMTYAPAPVADLVARGIETGSALLAQTVRQTFAATPAERDARNAHCAEHWDDWDGGDGTYFDGATEPPISLPSFAVPTLTDQLDDLAALGVHVEVDLLGVQVTLDEGLLDPVVDPVTDLVDDVVGTVGGTVDGTVGAIGGLLGSLGGWRRR